MRLSEEEGRYSEFLLDVGEDKIQKNENDEIELPEDMVLPILQNCSIRIVSSFPSMK